MKITLISTAGRLPSDGTRLISALLKRDGHEVRNVFMARTNPEYSIKEIAQLAPILQDTQLVLIAVYSNYSKRAIEVTQYVHAHFPDLLVIWGGPHCIASVEVCLKDADGVCYSEADEVIVEFVRKVEQGENYLDTPNMAFKKENGEIIVNQALPPFRDLDSLPYYDWDLNDHFILFNTLVPMTRERMRPLLEQYPLYVPSIYFLTTRGCPNKCSYCNNSRYISLFGKNIIRTYGVRRFMDELLDTVEALDLLDFVVFADDDFFVRSKRALHEFCDIYRKEVDLPFAVAVSPKTYSLEKLKILLEAPLKVIQVGVQSGSQRVLDEVFDRRIDLKNTMDILNEISEYCKKYDVILLADFIIDNPYETKKDIITSYRYLVELPKNVNVNVFNLTLYPGTPLYARAMNDGRLSVEGSGGYRSFVRSGLRFQKNYETFLILFYRYCMISSILSRIPKWVFRLLGSYPLRVLFGLLPESVFGRGALLLQVTKAWKKKYWKKISKVSL